MQSFKDRTPDLSKLTPPNGKKAITLHAEGDQVFRCTVDAKGAYWRFEQPKAELFDAKGELKGTHSGPMQAFDHVDGSRIISSRITAWVDPEMPEKDLKLALMTAVSDKGKLAFHNVKYIQRLDTEGGIPQGGCTPNDAGRLLKVPFKAEYIFWK